MRKRKWKRKVVSILLIVCLLAGTVPTAMSRTEAFSLDILSFVEKTGSIINGGKKAYEQAKKEKWSPGKAFFGTFKSIGQELLGIGGDESPGSTVVVNQVDLSQVEKELAGIQDTLKEQNITLNRLEADLKANTDSLAKQIAELGAKIDQTDQKKTYEAYLNNYFEFYNDFCEAMGRSESILNTMYTGDPTERAVKNAYDRVYELKGTKYTGDYYSAVENLGKYIQGKYQSTNPGSLIDILCKYYKLAGYDDNQTAEAIREFVAQTYYTYCLSNYYYMAVTLYQDTYMTEHDGKSYMTDFDVVLSKEEIEGNSKSMLEGLMKTTFQIFYDLNKHFCSLEDQKVFYEIPDGGLMRAMQDSKMDVEPGSSLELPKSEEILNSYFGEDYSKMFGDICNYTYESTDDAVTIKENKIQFADNLSNGKEINVDIYCTVADQKTKLHTYTFTGKKGALSGGYGTYEYPCMIKTTDDFYEFAIDYDMSGYYVTLMNDLDFSGKATSIVRKDFSGVFYGNGHTISHIENHYAVGEENMAVGGNNGLFARIAGGKVYDLTVKDCEFDVYGERGTYNIGTLAGKVCKKGIVERCEVVDSNATSSSNTVTASVGGIAGTVENGTLKGCVVRNSEASAGGNGTIAYIGGVAGFIHEDSTVTYCGRENTPIVSLVSTKDSAAGSVIGQARRSTVKNCWVYMTQDNWQVGQDLIKYANIAYGGFVGRSEMTVYDNLRMYDGTNASTSISKEEAIGDLSSGENASLIRTDDLNCEQSGFSSQSYLTNADLTGHPVRLHPVVMTLDTENVKKSYYYGEPLEMSGLVTYTGRGSVMGTVIPYEIETDYQADKAGTYNVKISVGKLEASYKVTVAKKPHTYEQVVEAATCTKPGKVTYKCTDEGCDAVLSSETLPQLGHKMEHHEKVEADYDNDGVKEYWSCTRCKKDFLDDKGDREATGEDLVIPMLRHEMEHHDKTIASTTKDGNVEYWHCTICEKNFLDEKGKQEIAEGAEVIAKASNIKLNTQSYNYDGKAKKPSVTVKDSKGKALAKVDYSVAYASGCKNVGSYTVTITLKNNYNGSVKKTFTIVPKTTSISKVTAGKKKMTVKWKKQATQTSGYQLQYGAASNFKGAKTTTITKNKTVSKSVSKLKAKKKYYVRIRTYKTVKVNGKSMKLYSTWSKAKSAKVK